MPTDPCHLEEDREPSALAEHRWIDERDNQLRVVVAISCFAALITASFCAGEVLIGRSTGVEITPFVFLLNAVLAMAASGAVGRYRRGNVGDVIAAMLIGGVIGMFAYVITLIIFSAAFLLLGCFVSVLLFGTSLAL